MRILLRGLADVLSLAIEPVICLGMFFSTAGILFMGSVVANMAVYPDKGLRDQIRYELQALRDEEDLQRRGPNPRVAPDRSSEWW